MPKFFEVSIQIPSRYDAPKQQANQQYGGKNDYPAKPGTPHPHATDLPQDVTRSARMAAEALEKPDVDPSVRKNRNRDIAQ